MADIFRPLRLGTIMMFGSLEFMPLGSTYDMVLLPPRDDAEPCPEPIPPQPVRGRRSGHHVGGARCGRQRSRISDPAAEARTRPALPRTFLIRSLIPLAHAAPEIGPVERRALLHEPTGGHHDPLFCPGQRAKHSSHLHFKRRTRGLQLLSTLPRRPKQRWEDW